MYRYRQMLKGALLMGVALMLAVGCHHKKPKVYSPSQVQFSVEYNAFLESQFYPSLVMGVSSLATPYPGQSDGDALFIVSVTAPVSNAVLRIDIDSSILNYVTIVQEVLPLKDVRYTFYPSIKWNSGPYVYLLYQRRGGGCEECEAEFPLGQRLPADGA